MLYGLEIENFFSIRDRQVIDLRVPPNVQERTEALVPIWSGADYRVPRVIAVFGANGGGKSNVLRALSFVSQFVRFSFSWLAGQSYGISAFADETAALEPTAFTLHFGGPKDLVDPKGAQCAYSYELELENLTSPKIKREAVYYSPGRSRRRLIERIGSGVKAADEFALSDRKAIEAVLRPDASLIGTLAQLNHPYAQLMVATASLINSNIYRALYEWPDEQVISWYQSSDGLLEALNRDITRLDVGIEDASLVTQTTGRTMTFRHLGLSEPISLDVESHGTRQFLRIFPYLYTTLATGGVAVIDELDSGIHPMILPEIARWFYDDKRNPYGAQLWMTCQSASFLEELAKEQVLFCEKDDRGRTSVFRLADIKSVRRVDNFYKKYISGIYGAVPKIG